LGFKETFEVAIFSAGRIALFIEEYFEALHELMRRPATILPADLLSRRTYSTALPAVVLIAPNNRMDGE